VEKLRNGKKENDKLDTWYAYNLFTAENFRKVINKSGNAINKQKFRKQILMKSDR
jgi:hypothetical protein